MKKMLSTIALLQLFAYNPQAQPANALYDTSGNVNPNLSPENQTYYDKQLIRRAKPKLVHYQLGQKRNIPRRSGQSVNFRSFASLGKAMTPLVEGVTPEGQSLSVTEITAKPRQYGNFVALTDYIDMTAIDPVVTEAVQLIGDQAGLTDDSVVRDEIHLGVNYAFAPKLSGGTETAVYSRYLVDGTCLLTVKEVEKQVAELRAQNAPTFEGGYYVVIAHPYTLFDLMQDSRWRDPQQYTNNVHKIFEGEVGAIGGARFISTTEAKIFKGDNLAGDTRTLTASSTAQSTAATTVTISSCSQAASNGLKGRFIIVGGKCVEITASTATQLTVSEAVTYSSSETIYPGEGGAGGIGVFSCMFVGKDAYGVTEIEGGGMQTIVKPLGSGGTSDPLNQRSTIGWKSLLTAKILVSEYLRCLVVGGTFATVNLKKN